MSTGPNAAYPTSLDLLCLAFKALLISRTTINPNLIFYTDVPESYPATGYPFVAIAQGEYQLGEGEYTGGGRYDSWIEGIIYTTVVFQSAKDQAQRNEVRMHGNPEAIPPLLGLNSYDHQIINALHGIFVPDADGNFLTIEPVKFQRASRPKAYSGNESWTGVEMSFKVIYVALLTLPE